MMPTWAVKQPNGEIEYHTAVAMSVPLWPGNGTDFAQAAAAAPAPASRPAPAVTLSAIERAVCAQLGMTEAAFNQSRADLAARHQGYTR